MLTLKHVMQNLLRSQARLQRLLSLDAGEDLPAEAGELMSVDLLFGDVASSEDFRLLKRVALDQCTIPELAQELGVSVEACKKRARRASTVWVSGPAECALSGGITMDELKRIIDSIYEA